MEPKEIPLSKASLPDNTSGNQDSEAGKAGSLGYDPYHQASDKDSSQSALHHTIGISQNQVSAGTHIHDGMDSRLLPDLEDLTSQFENHDHESFGPTFIPNITDVNRTTWNPVWTSENNPQPVKNDGTLVGDYVLFGPMVFFTIWWKPGAATTYGTGRWIFSLPVTPASIGALNTCWGLLYQEGGGGSRRFPMVGVIDNSELNRLIASDAKTGPANPIIGSSGWYDAPAVNDYMFIQGWYWWV